MKVQKNAVLPEHLRRFHPAGNTHIGKKVCKKEITDKSVTFPKFHIKTFENHRSDMGHGHLFDIRHT